MREISFMTNKTEKISKEKIEQLVELYREGLIYFIARYVKDLDEAEDLAEDVFVEIIMHPKRFRQCSSEKTYLYAIGRNLAVDFLRKNHRLSYVDPLILYSENYEGSEREMSLAHEAMQDDTETLRLAEGNMGGSPEDILIERERNIKILEALGKIKPEYGEAIRLVYFEEMSYEEAAQVMKKSRKQVENLIYRGKKSIGSLLKSEEIFFE